MEFFELISTFFVSRSSNRNKQGSLSGDGAWHNSLSSCSQLPRAESTERYLCCLPLVTAPLSFSRPAALPPFFPPYPLPFLCPIVSNRTQTLSLDLHWLSSNGVQIALLPLVYMRHKFRCPPAKKEVRKKKIRRDAPLATEVTVRATGPLPLPPPAGGRTVMTSSFCFLVFFPHHEHSVVAVLQP